MGEHFSTLRNIIGIIRDSCDILHTIDESLVRPGEGIIVKTRKFLMSIQWYIYTPIAIVASAYFLPKILKMLAEWMNSLRSGSTDVQNAWNGPVIKMSPIDKVIKKLSTVLNTVRKCQNLVLLIRSMMLS